MQLSNNNPAHFPCLKDLSNARSAWNLGQFKEEISILLQNFQQRFQVFDELETEFKIFCSPFSVTPSELRTDMQLEIIDLQCDSTLKEKFASVGLEIFMYLFPGYLKLRDLAAKYCSCLELLTYVSKFRSFSVMSINKTSSVQG